MLRLGREPLWVLTEPSFDLCEANLHLFGSQGHASAALKNLHTSFHFGSYFLRQPCLPAPRSSFLPLQRSKKPFAENGLKQQFIH
jgi:hypothetical protein